MRTTKDVIFTLNSLAEDAHIEASIREVENRQLGKFLHRLGTTLHHVAKELEEIDPGQPAKVQQAATLADDGGTGWIRMLLAIIRLKLNSGDFSHEQLEDVKAAQRYVERRESPVWTMQPASEGPPKADAEVESLKAQLDEARYEARKYYLADGSFELMDTPEEVITRRIQAAREINIERVLRRAQESMEDLQFGFTHVPTKLPPCYAKLPAEFITHLDATISTSEEE